MLVDINVHAKPDIYTTATFKLEHFQSEADYKQALAIIFMVSADYYLDPELDVENIVEFVSTGREKSKDNLTLEASEDGLELEFS